MAATLDVAQVGAYVEISGTSFRVAQVGAYVEIFYTRVRTAQVGAYVEIRRILMHAAQVGAYIEIGEAPLPPIQTTDNLSNSIRAQSVDHIKQLTQADRQHYDTSKGKL